MVQGRVRVADRGFCGLAFAAICGNETKKECSMGLLRAGIGAASGVLADSWRDYFYCDSLTANVLMTKGTRRQKSKKSEP